MKRKSQLELIHCIGDSHVNFFSGVDHMQNSWPSPSWSENPTFRTYRLGPVLAYNLVAKNSKTKGREKLFKVISILPKNSRVLLSFGEIDCRAHLLKQAQTQRKHINQLIVECVTRYLSVALEVKAMGHQVIIWNVVPPSLEAVNSTEYPSFGSREERAKVTELFNDALAKFCDDHDLLFACIYDKLIKPNGVPNQKFFRDQIHLSKIALPLVKDEFEKLIPTLFIQTNYNNQIQRILPRNQDLTDHYRQLIKDSIYAWALR